MKVDFNKKLESFLSKFPDDAKSWSEATDEIRELAREIRINYNRYVLQINEDSEGGLEAVDFRSIKIPSEWNKKAKNFILKYWNTLPKFIKEELYYEKIA